MTTKLELKESVKNIIINRHGKHMAIKAKELARLFHLKDDRRVRIAIRELIAEGYPIAAIMEKPFGYFIIETIEEAREYQQSLKDRLIEDALRRRDFKQCAAQRLDLVTQGKLI